MSLTFNIPEAMRTKPKIYINIGCLLDIPTATLVEGKYGETIYNGGLGPITAVVGTGNNFKSTITHYMLLSAMDKIVASGFPTLACTYDTEGNVSIDRLEALASKHPNLPSGPISGEKPYWYITDKTIFLGNVWDKEVLKPHIEDKKKLAPVAYEAFRNPYTKKPLEASIPTFVEIDSISEFEGEISNEMLQKDLDSSDTNTFAMKQGLFKSKFLSNVPNMSVGTNTYVLITAQLGEKIDMRTGPAAYSQPLKPLQYLKAGEQIKGVSPKFFFLTHNAWYAHTAKALINDGTKLPEYPLTQEDNKTDLNTVTLTQLRGKNGPSGCTPTILVSQKEGVLPSLTEFHFIKESKRYGIAGSLQHYHLELYPECSLSRTTVRGKLDSDPKLRRAVNITAEMLQLQTYHPILKTEGLICSPKELYDDLKKIGYDWNVLLSTRGYWTINQYSNPIPFLSTVDLLKMRKGTYKPYFLDSKLQLKKDYKGVLDAK